MRLVLSAVIATLVLSVLTPPGAAQMGSARVRVIHASPDAPAVDVLVDGTKAISNLAFKAASPYANVSAGTRTFQVFPAGTMTGKPVIEVSPALEGGKDYTVIALGRLAEIAPGLFADDNAPATGKAKVRFIHASPNTPAVDIALKDGPVVFANVAFKVASRYAAVDAGTYNFEARPAGTTTSALDVPGVRLEAGRVYTVVALGLLNGQPALSVILTADR